MNSKIKNIIFDWGGVLIDVTPEPIRQGSSLNMNLAISLMTMRAMSCAVELARISQMRKSTVYGTQ